MSTELHYPIEGLPEPGTAVEVADGVHWIRMPLPFALDHINLWLLRDGAGWVIVDSGFATDATRRHWEQIFERRLGGRPVHRIVVTHLHPDHLGLAAWLAERFDAAVWMTQAEFLYARALWSAADSGLPLPFADLFRRHGLDEARAGAIGARTGAYRRGVPRLPAEFRRLAGDDRLDIDGRPWRIIIGQGHSPEHAALYCEALGLLISGDMVLPKISTNVSVSPLEPEGNPLALFLASLERYRPLPDDTLVLPSHGAVFRGLHRRLDALGHHHRERFALLEDACRTPRTAAELLTALFRRELDPHQLVFAMGEAIAHLNYLMHAGRLQRVTGADRIYRFVRAA